MLSRSISAAGVDIRDLAAFKQIADTEASADAAQLAGGIYQALVTTVFGLLIAIPSLAAFALLRSRVDELVAKAAYAALHALSPLKQPDPGQQPPVVMPPPPPPQGKSFCPICVSSVFHLWLLSVWSFLRSFVFFVAILFGSASSLSPHGNDQFPPLAFA